MSDIPVIDPRPCEVCRKAILVCALHAWLSAKVSVGPCCCPGCLQVAKDNPKYHHPAPHKGQKKGVS
jgi:hypothetical protein